MKKIKLMADYQCYPLWLNSDDAFGNIDPNSLPISNVLKNELNSWSDKYDETLNLDDPLTSGFATLDDERVFRKMGQSLKEKLQMKLGDDYEVIYQQ